MDTIETKTTDFGPPYGGTFSRHIRRMGNSLGLGLPAFVIDQAGIRENDLAQAKYRVDDGRVTIYIEVETGNAQKTRA